MFDSLRLHGLYSSWNSPGQNTGVGSLSLLQGISPTQGLNPGLPQDRQILYQLSHKGNPRTPERIAYPSPVDLPTQESNRGHLHCRWILYQLSYQGSPKICGWYCSNQFSSVAQLCPTLCNPMDYTVHGILQAKILEWVDFLFSPGDLPNPGIELRSPALQAGSLPVEPPGKPKNTRVGSLSLLQGIFPTQESNCGLLHCRWILYQLSYQGSPYRL